MNQEVQHPEDSFMLQAAENVLSIYKANQLEKAGSLKYFGVITTTIVSIVIAFSSFWEPKTQAVTYEDKYLTSSLLVLLYFMGLVLLRKLFAIRKNTVVLSVELGNIYRYFTTKYPDVQAYVGKSFRLWAESDTHVINRKGSDYFNFVVVAIISTLALIASTLFLKNGLEAYFSTVRKMPLDLDWMIYILEPAVVVMNVFIFRKFETMISTQHSAVSNQQSEESSGMA